MSKNKIGLQVSGLDEYMAKLDEIGGSKAIKKGVEKGLIEAKKIGTPKIQASISKLPAGGKYSTGKTEKSLDTNLTVDWEGTAASIDVGFNLKESGDTSIFLMHGTPINAPIKGLKTAVYGQKTQKEIKAAEIKAINEVITEIMNG